METIISIILILYLIELLINFAKTSGGSFTFILLLFFYIAYLIITYLTELYKSGSITQYILIWRELYIIIAYVFYLILSYYFTKNKFKVVSYNKKEDQGNINLNDSINFMVRPIVFFIATIFIWFRIDFFLLAIHFNILHSYAQIVLSVIFGIVFSLWPSSSLNGLAYSFILVHIRAAYLIIRIVALVVKILAFLLCLIVYILIITYPILIYFSIIYFLYPYFSGSIDLSNVTYVILIIGCITILIMTVRATWDILVDLSKDKLKMPSKIIVLISRNLKFFNKKVDINTIIFKKMCRRLYNNISTFTLHLGAFLGGNIL